MLKQVRSSRVRHAVEVEQVVVVVVVEAGRPTKSFTLPYQPFQIPCIICVITPFIPFERSTAARFVALSRRPRPCL